jgi:long-subunit fatty acid transport protein
MPRLAIVPNLILTIALLLGIVSTSSAQQLLDPFDVYESATENQFLPGGRAAGMGGAQIAAGDDGSALWYNPALLTRIRNTELSGTLSHQRLTNSTTLARRNSPEAKVNNTSFGGLWAIFPVPAEQGGLTLGFSINRVRSFDRIFRLNTDQPFAPTAGEDENGSLWAWSFGGAVEVSPKASLGVSVDIFDGTDNYSYFEYSFGPTDEPISYTHSIIDEYTGISGKIGANYQASNELNLGVVIGFPTSLTVDQTSDEFQVGPGAFEDHSLASYRYTLPFTFGVGAMVRLNDLSITGDATYVDYTQLKYRSGFPDLARANLTAMQYYDDVLNFHLGTEYFVRSADLRLRAGIFGQPIPFNGLPVETEPFYFTLGAGLLVERVFNIDMAFMSGLYEREDPTLGSSEEYSTQRFLMTVSYRIGDSQ